MAKHVSPSKIRYREKNPMISIRLTKSLREALDLARGEESYAKFVGDLLRKEVKDLHVFVLKNSYNRGYADAKKKYKITYPCASCGKPITMFPGDEDHEFVKKQLKEEGWSHGSCVE